jgi:hypothetical protein
MFQVELYIVMISQLEAIVYEYRPKLNLPDIL